jgi:hypothetical protein
LHQLNAMAGFAVARRDRVLVERVGDEVVLYDQEADIAHCLPASVAAVWEHADGTRSDQQLAAAAGLEPRQASDALDQLREAELIETPADAEHGHTRREAARRILGTGAVAAAAPLIYTLAIAPAAAMASGTACSYTCEVDAEALTVVDAQYSASILCVLYSEGDCKTCVGSAFLQGDKYGYSGVCYS